MCIRARNEDKMRSLIYDLWTKNRKSLRFCLYIREFHIETVNCQRYF